MSEASSQFVLRMTRCQDRLYAYIRALVFDVDAAREILQETNVVMLAKAAEPAAEENFDAWACKVAYYEVLSYRRDRARDRLELFDERLLEQVAARAEEVGRHADRRSRALEACLDGLPSRQRELISARYGSSGTVKSLAEHFGRPARTLATQLFRIRQQLLDCIERRLQGERLTEEPQ